MSCIPQDDNGNYRYKVGTTETFTFPNFLAGMTRKRPIKTLLIAGLAAFSFGWTSAPSLELGHVRSNRRGWTEQSAPKVDGRRSEQKLELQEEVEGAADAGAIDEGVLEDPVVKRVGYVKRFRSAVGGLSLIPSKEKGPSLKHGYLTYERPPALRFSDVDLARAAPPSPALPEFTFVPNEYLPYLVENELSEEAMKDAAMLSSIVVDLAPHEVVSGLIDTRRAAKEEIVVNYDLDERHSAVLRPEEVLIFFETDSSSSAPGVLVPFSPATPSSTTTIRSSATLRKE